MSIVDDVALEAFEFVTKYPDNATRLSFFQSLAGHMANRINAEFIRKYDTSQYEKLLDTFKSEYEAKYNTLKIDVINDLISSLEEERRWIED